jgi:glycosyltransferase involved in cell wall biosynthesis
VSSSVRISIIIPAYNEERYLKRCLDSVASQLEQPYEVIVVDNNSTDATVTIAHTYPFVRLLQEKNQGRVYARNAGFQAAGGDILARIDADAELPPDWTQSIRRYFEQPGTLETSWTGAAWFYNVRFPHVVSAIYNALVFRFNLLLIGHPTLWGSNMAVPKRLWSEVRNDVCLRTDVHEDLDLAIHLHRRGRHIHSDRHVKTHVQLRRVHANRHELWDYLQMWPRTLRTHGFKTWPICWVFGDVLLYAVSPLFSISERVARLFGRRPLED